MKRIITVLMIVIAFTISSFTPFTETAMSVTAYAAESSFDETDLARCDDAWQTFRMKSSKGWLGINYSPSKIEADAVGAVQKMLNFLLDANLVIDKTYGEKTQACAIELQQRFGISRDGCIGPESYSFLYNGCYEKIQMNKATSGTIVSLPEKVVLDSSGTAYFDVHFSGTVSRVQLWCDDATLAVTSGSGSLPGNLTATIRVSNLSEKAVNVSFKIYNKNGTDFIQTVKVLTSAIDYDTNAVMKFCKGYNGKGLCAEFAYLAAKAGGMKFDKYYTGCTSMVKYLKKQVNNGIGEFYQLKVENNGTILGSSKVSVGDLIFMHHATEPDGLPWVHVVVVSEVINGKPIKVYARNNRYDNETYYGFDCCGACNSSNNVTAWVYHIAQ